MTAIIRPRRAPSRRRLTIADLAADGAIVTASTEPTAETLLRERAAPCGRAGCGHSYHEHLDRHRHIEAARSCRAGCPCLVYTPAAPASPARLLQRGMTVQSDPRGHYAYCVICQWQVGPTSHRRASAYARTPGAHTCLRRTRRARA